MKSPDNLDFNQDTSIDHEISSKASNFSSSEEDLNRFLPSYGMSLVLQNHG